MKYTVFNLGSLISIDPSMPRTLCLETFRNSTHRLCSCLNEMRINNLTTNTQTIKAQWANEPFVHNILGAL